ncbi:hypothetical protein Vretifemale_12715 [Volvox reticuliferus]|nr:hypothetical protein Vretifemale_12715 [Volvox reticuliferus]
MLQPTAGSATVNGFDVATQMDQVRASLGICPQFDILWPDLTVYEHLEMYGAIKGYQWNEIREAAIQAATSVNLESKLQCAAGELSGGQRRKLSVAIAFLGNPALVFLDEPTSGMDPYSRRFTWEVIRQHRSGAAIVLTTHSMEEADLLGDRVVILARGRVAAAGTGMELKAKYGVGYNLTLVIDPRQQQPQPPLLVSNDRDRVTAQQLLQPPTVVAVAASHGVAGPYEDLPPTTASSPEAAVIAIVRQHVPAAELLSAAGAEVVIRLPREAAGAFPALLRDLDGPVGRQQLGVASYGLSLTTLEEVFLSITAAAEQQADTRVNGADVVNGVTSAVNTDGSTSTEPSGAVSASGVAAAPPPPPPPPPAHPQPLHGWRLYGQQLRALLTKRALCARRDRLAVLTQLAVPLALVYLALWISSLKVREHSQPPLELSRRTALFNRPLVWSASLAARNASEGCNISTGGSGGGGSSSCLAALLAGHPARAGAIDSAATALYAGDPRVRSATLEDYLLRHWYGGSGPVYDALHVTGLPPPATVASPMSAAPLSFVLLTNQSAVSALPAALAEALTAAWSYTNDGMPKTPTGAVRRGDNSGGVSAIGRPPSSSSSSSSLSFSVVSWPLPLLATELVAQIEHNAASLMLVLCLVLASSVLSASFVIFVVREQENNSKHLQLVSGAPATAYWAANYGWDLLSYSLSAAGLLALIVWYRLPQFSGPRLGAVAALLWGFGPAGISLTYLLHFLFRDEMCALQRLNTAYFLTGYLGFVTTWICDLIEMFVWPPGALHDWNRAAKWALRTASPHYCFARGMYDVQATYEVASGPHNNPFSWDVFGSPMAHMTIQTLVYGSFAVLYDAGVLTRLYLYGKDTTWIVWRWLRREKPGQLAGREGQSRGSSPPGARRRGWWMDSWWRSGGQQQHADGGSGAGVGRADTASGDAARLLALEEGVPLAAAAAASQEASLRSRNDGRHNPYLYDTHGGHAGYPSYGSDHGILGAELVEDEDVSAEKRAVITGLRNNCQVLLDGVRKSYSQGLFRPAVAAVRGLWVGVPAGECFGLLGVNGAGKTTTFRMVTGEVLPDAGDARVGGFSVRTQLAAARRQLGYCPQFEALPGAMTGREVVAMYARLRGVPEPYVDELASYLLRRLGLEGAANNPCGGYSGGMKRKLGVAVALVGDPRVCALDEPSTGMDPGARRALWTCLQNEVIRAGRTVVLTSHSMEECEALCTRLTILVAGRQRCLGTVQHLKSRFGGGYVLEIKTLPRSSSATSLEAGVVQSPYPSAHPRQLSTAITAAHGGEGGTSDGVASREAPNIQPAAAVPASSGVGAAATDATLAAWLSSVCPGAVLSHVDQNRYTFTIPRVLGGRASPGGPSLDLATLFEAVESSRADLGVVDYCLTQTTLEQLFVSLAGAAAAATRTEEGTPGF